MTNVKRTEIGLAVACLCALGLASAASAAITSPAEPGYLTDSRGLVVRSNYGLCWRAGSDPDTASSNACDPKPAPAPTARVEQAPQPAVVAAAPMPAPAVQKVTLDADTLFDFNKSVLRPAGRTALDEFVAKARAIDPETIVAIGHADRLGSEAYNQRLSERRVEAVKVYLVSQGIEANRIRTEGRGETQPVTKAGECLGRKSAKVIACLQPDRRVEIELIGKRSGR